MSAAPAPHQHSSTLKTTLNAHCACALSSVIFVVEFALIAYSLFLHVFSYVLIPIVI